MSRITTVILDGFFKEDNPNKIEDFKHWDKLNKETFDQYVERKLTSKDKNVVRLAEAVKRVFLQKARH